jgi:hypothetical protein
VTNTNTGSAQKTGGPFSAFRAFALTFPGLAFVLPLAAGLLLPALPLAAQETTGNYFIRQTESGAQVIVQRLSWPVDENASRYEIVVERESSGAFAPVHRESAADKNYADISLGPGKYRYQVLVFNLLGQFEHATNWASFNIILALQPEIASHTPEVLYIYEASRWEIRLAGKNLVEDGAAYLVPLEDPENPAQAAGPVKIVEYAPEESAARLAFDPGNLRPGLYRILVRNPGGLEASSGPLRVETFPPYDIELSIGYAPLLPLYGYLFDIFEGFAPLGMDLRASLVFFKRTWGFLGVETNLHLNYLSAGMEEADATAYIAGGNLSLLYRKLLPPPGLVFNARLGGGLAAAPLGLKFDYGSYTSDPVTSWVPLAAIGASLEYRFSLPLYAELGASYEHLFSRDTPQPGFLRPFLNLGWKF